MKYMTGKAKMMVTGIALGTVAAGGMAALIAAGKVGVIGSLVVVFLMALAGVSGWMIGIQMRVKIEHDEFGTYENFAKAFESQQNGMTAGTAAEGVDESERTE